MKVQVEGTNFVKDTNTGALLMTSKNALIENEARKKILERAQRKDEEINKLKNKIENISSDIKDLKDLLHTLLTQSKR